MKIGHVVPYKNTRGNICEAKINSFKIVENGNVWFYGTDTITKAEVFYPIHLSANLLHLPEGILQGLKVLTNPTYETGREGCTYSDTDYSSIDVCFGYNLAKDEIREYVKKLIMKM